MCKHRFSIVLVMVVMVAQLEISVTDGSVIKKRNLAEDIRTGINLAGKIFGKWCESVGCISGQSMRHCFD